MNHPYHLSSNDSSQRMPHFHIYDWAGNLMQFSSGYSSFQEAYEHLMDHIAETMPDLTEDGFDLELGEYQVL